MRKLLPILALLFLCGAAPTALPKMDELRRLFDAKEYRPCLAGIAKVTSAPPTMTKSYDMFDLLMLKGEALLHLKESALAHDVFVNASEESSKPRDAALAKATALLVNRANRDGMYVPKRAKPHAPIPMLDADNRKPAFEALLADELVEVQPKVKAAMGSKTLLDVAAALTQLMTVNAVELTATDSDKQTQKMVADLKDHAKSLITAELKRLDADVQRIQNIANQWVLVPDDPRDGKGNNNRNNGYRLYEKRGLTGNQQADLRDAIDTCQKIIPAARELAGALGKKSAPNDFAAVIADAERVQKDADSVLHAGYGGTKRERRY